MNYKGKVYQIVVTGNESGSHCVGCAWERDGLNLADSVHLLRNKGCMAMPSDCLRGGKHWVLKIESKRYRFLKVFSYMAPSSTSFIEIKDDRSLQDNVENMCMRDLVKDRLVFDTRPRHKKFNTDPSVKKRIKEMLAMRDATLYDELDRMGTEEFRNILELALYEL